MMEHLKGKEGSLSSASLLPSCVWTMETLMLVKRALTNSRFAKKDCREQLRSRSPRDNVSSQETTNWYVWWISLRCY
jgi:hypothetical protein